MEMLIKSLYHYLDDIKKVKVYFENCMLQKNKCMSNVTCVTFNSVPSFNDPYDGINKCIT